MDVFDEKYHVGSTGLKLHRDLLENEFITTMETAMQARGVRLHRDRFDGTVWSLNSYENLG